MSNKKSQKCAVSPTLTNPNKKLYFLYQELLQQRKWKKKNQMMLVHDRLLNTRSYFLNFRDQYTDLSQTIT